LSDNGRSYWFQFLINLYEKVSNQTYCY
jgi:hypothetical protein